MVLFIWAWILQGQLLIKIFSIFDRFRQLLVQRFRQEEWEKAAAEREGAVHDQRQRSPEFGQHVEVGAEDAADPEKCATYFKLQLNIAQKSYCDTLLKVPIN